MLLQLPEDERKAFPTKWYAHIGRGPPPRALDATLEFYRRRLHQSTVHNQQLILRYMACLRLGIFLPEHSGRFVDVSHDESEDGPRICKDMMEAQERNRGRQVFVH